MSHCLESRAVRQVSLHTTKSEGIVTCYTYILVTLTVPSFLTLLNELKVHFDIYITFSSHSNVRMQTLQNEYNAILQIFFKKMKGTL